jgi:hypothetical protein
MPAQTRALGLQVPRRNRNQAVLGIVGQPIERMFVRPLVTQASRRPQ